MASLSYPVWMPRPLQSGFSMQPEDRRIASSTVGTSFQQGFGGDVCVAECTVLLNSMQSAWLEQWERDAARQGSVWFDFPLWYGGQIHWEKCRFKTRPKLASASGLYSRFSFSLYVRRRTELMPECMVKVFSCYPPCFFVSAVKAVDELLAYFPQFFSSIAVFTSSDVASALAEITEE